MSLQSAIEMDNSIHFGNTKHGLVHVNPTIACELYLTESK